MSDEAQQRARGSGGGDSESLVRRIAAIADEKLGEDLVALDVRELVGYTDFLLICTARNERLAKSVGDEVRERLKRERYRLEQLWGEAPRLELGIGDGPAREAS